MKNIFLLIFIAISMVACDYIPLLEDEPVKDDAYYAIKALSKSFENLGVQDSNIALMLSEVPSFDFSTFEIEAHEGCTDYLVYPGGWSGPTISCGLDLGNIGRENVKKAIHGLVSEKDFNILMSATYFKGPEADAWVKRHKNFRIGKHAAIMICNRVKKIVWNHAVNMYPNIINAPACVKKAVLMQCVLSGAGSDRLQPIGVAIANSDWMGVADLIATIRSDMIGGPYERIWRDDQRTANIIRLTLNPPKNRKIDYD